MQVAGSHMEWNGKRNGDKNEAETTERVDKKEHGMPDCVGLHYRTLLEFTACDSGSSSAPVRRKYKQLHMQGRPPSSSS